MLLLRATGTRTALGAALRIGTANAREWIRLLKAYGAIRQPPDETTNESAFSRGRGTPARQAADEHRLTQIKEGAQT